MLEYVSGPAILLQDVKEISAIHRKIFAGTLSGQLGISFLSDYYQRIKASSDGIIVVCRDQGRVVGFIAGLSSRQTFLSALLMRNLLPIIKELGTHPLIFKNIFRFLKRSFTLKEKELSAELMSIAVLPEYRGQGIATRLLSQMEEFFKIQHVKNYKVFTDLESSTGAGFYEKSGFNLRQEVDLLGIQARLYTKML